MKNIRVFHLKNFSFLEVKFFIYLNRGVFIMNNVIKHCCVFIFFLNSVQKKKKKKCGWVHIRSHWAASNAYPQHMLL